MADNISKCDITAKEHKTEVKQHELPVRYLATILPEYRKTRQNTTKHRKTQNAAAAMAVTNDKILHAL